MGRGVRQPAPPQLPGEYALGVKRAVGLALLQAPALWSCRSLHSMLCGLKLIRHDTAHAGKDTFPLTKRVRADAARQNTKSID